MFWSNIWEKDTKHNGNAEWLKDVKRKFKNIEKRQDYRCRTVEPTRRKELVTRRTELLWK